jgi:iron(III) transport system permease protein
LLTAHGRDRGRGLATGISLAILGTLTAIPLLFMFWTSIRDTASHLPFDPEVGYTLDNYAQILASSQTIPLILTTVAFSAGSLIIGLVLAGILAWLVERTDTHLRSFAYMALLAQIAMPGVIFSIAWILLLAPNNGLVNAVIRGITGAEGPGPLNIYTIPGMFFVQGLIIVPTTFLLISPAFRLTDPTLEEAASVAGASRRQVLASIGLPLLIPALANAAIYEFTTVVQAFDVPAVVGLQAGVPLLSTKVFQASNPAVGLPDYGVVSANAVVLLVASAVPLLWYARIVRTTAKFAVIRGRGYRPRRISLGRWRWLGGGFIAAYVGIAFVLPAFIMFWMSVQPFYSNPSAESLSRITFKAFGSITSPQVLSAASNTAIIAVGTAFATTILGTLIGWVIVRGKGRLIGAVDVLSFAPHIIPGVVVAVSTLLLFLVLGGWLDMRIHGSLFAIIFALTTVTLGFAIRAMRSATLSIHGELEEAALVSGMSWASTMRRVVLPLLTPAVGNVWIWAIIQGITNLTIVLLLYAGPNAVLSVEIYNRWNTGSISEAAAIGVVLLVITIVLTVTARRVVMARGIN